MADVFISYKSERRKAARHMAKVLASHGFTAWYDYGLVPGDDFEARIESEIAAASVVLVLWCEMAVRSEWVAKEARQARSQGKYLPAWIQRAPLPHEFSAADTIDLTGWDGAPRSHALDRVLVDIGRRLNRSPAPDFHALRELDEDWRGFGAPNLAAFALGEAPPARRELGFDGALNALKGLFRQEADAKPAQRLDTVSLEELPPTLTAQSRAIWHKAGKGDPIALVDLGLLYQHGTGGVPQDQAIAIALWRMAARKGYHPAQSVLAQMHETW